MQRFAELLDRLVYTPSRNAKLDLMEAYFRATPDPDRGYALAAMTDALSFRLPFRRLLADLLAPHVDPVLLRLSRDYVGDTAETVALLWPDRATDMPPPAVGEVVLGLTEAGRDGAELLIGRWLDTLDATGRWALLKLMTGALRVGVSARLAKTAVARLGGIDVGEVEEVWHGLAPPYLPLFDWLEGCAARPAAGLAPVFRPLMLAHPLEEAEVAGLDPATLVAEWKWDGIRAQLSGNGWESRLYSRTGDDISAAFPDVIEAFGGFDGVVDGELLVVRDGAVAPFQDLQQRLNRKSVAMRQLREHPAHMRLYDVLFAGSVDVRPLPFTERRVRLEQLTQVLPPDRVSLSPLVPFDRIADLELLREEARANAIEGLMLKVASSPYVAGRPKGLWYKWKRDPLTADCVLMYAQRGSGKRSSFYSDYTFGAWRDGAAGDELVPVGKAYSGFTDEELRRIDKFVRDNTTERFGPVRAVRPALVLEVAFDAIQASTRHKSGIAMRFPRIHRIRWDKPAAEADRLDDLMKLAG